MKVAEPGKLVVGRCSADKADEMVNHRTVVLAWTLDRLGHRDSPRDCARDRALRATSRLDVAQC
jgi:hypothetical protein